MSEPSTAPQFAVIPGVQVQQALQGSFVRRGLVCDLSCSLTSGTVGGLRDTAASLLRCASVMGRTEQKAAEPAHRGGPDFLQSSTVPLPEFRARHLERYLAKERPAAASEPLFQVQYEWYGGEKKTRRMSGQRVWKIIKDLGKRVGVDTIHPHAFRHACGVELLKRSGGNLRAVQEHLRHADIQTTIYTRLAPQDLQKVVNLFDEKTEALRARGLRTGGPQTGFEPVSQP